MHILRNITRLILQCGYSTLLYIWDFNQEPQSMQSCSVSFPTTELYKKVCNISPYLISIEVNKKVNEALATGLWRSLNETPPTTIGTLANMLSRDMRFLTMSYVRPAKAQTSLRICAVWSEPLLVVRIFYDC